MLSRSFGCMSFQVQFRLDKEIFSDMRIDLQKVEAWYNVEKDYLVLCGKPYPTCCFPFGKINDWLFIGPLAFENLNGEMKLDVASSRHLLSFSQELGLDTDTDNIEIKVFLKYEGVIFLLFTR